LRDAVKRRRWRQCKLTEEQVVAIREKFATGAYTLAALGREYGVSYQQISNIIHRRQRWDT
jgi:transposase